MKPETPETKEIEPTTEEEKGRLKPRAVRRTAQEQQRIREDKAKRDGTLLEKEKERLQEIREGPKEPHWTIRAAKRTQRFYTRGKRR